MHLIYATAYRSRSDTVEISKKALKLFFKTSIPFIQKSVDELLNKPVTINATGLKNGAEACKTTILSSYVNNSRSFTFTLSSSIFNALDFKNSKYLYIHVSLKKIRDTTAVNSLSLLPFLEFRSRQNQQFTCKIDQLGILMNITDIGEKPDRFIIRGKLKQVIKSFFWSNDARIVESKLKYDVTISMKPTMRPLHYQQHQTQDVEDFTLEAPEEYYVPAREFAALLNNVRYKKTPSSVNALKQNWMIYCNKNRENADFDVFKQEIYKKGRLNETSKKDVEDAFKFWSGLSSFVNKNEDVLEKF